VNKIVSNYERKIKIGEGIIRAEDYTPVRKNEPIPQLSTKMVKISQCIQRSHQKAMSESKALEVPIVASKSQVKESVGDITVDEDSFEEEEDDTSFADSGQLPSGTSDVKNVVV